MSYKKLPVKKEIKKKRKETDVTDEFLDVKNEELKIRDLKWTQKQMDLVRLILDRKTKVVFIKGPAGTSKSILSVYAGLKLLQEKRTEEIVYIRSVVESASKGLGFLPGTSGDKTAPFAMPLLQKLDELLPKAQVDGLMESESVRAISNHFLRGVQYRSYVIVDEAQGFERFEIKTVLTRLAEGGKFVFTGDPTQSDIKHSGFIDYYNLFNDEASREKGIHCFEFTKDDIVRSQLLKFICAKIEELG